MKVDSIPVINPELYYFNIKFDCTDTIPGERHFLEHMMLNTNHKFTKEELRLELAKLGDQNLFNAATSNEDIYFSGGYLKEDAERAIELLNSVLEGPLFLEDEVEKEREIILQELFMHQDDLFFQAFKSIGDALGEDLNIIGTEETIRSITAEDLRACFKRSIHASSAEIQVHNGTCEVKLSDGKTQDHKTIPFPAENIHVENDNMSSSVVFHVFNSKTCFENELLASYLSHTSAMPFTKLREELRACYSVGAMDSVSGEHLMPYFALHAVTDKDPLMVADELKKCAVLDNEDIFKSIWKSWRMNFVKSKTSIPARFAMEEVAKRYGMSYDELSAYVVTWDELKAAAEKVFNQELCTIIVQGTKSDFESDEEE